MKRVASSEKIQIEIKPAEDDGWSDNSSWLHWSCSLDDKEEDNLLHVGEQKVRVRWVFQYENYKLESGDVQFFAGLAYDREGNFYGITESSDSPHRDTISQMVKLGPGKRALVWFARYASWDATFTRELTRAIDNPAFEFMSLMPSAKTAKKPRKKAAPAPGCFHEQLHMATALVESVRKLDAEPNAENLSDACRSASALHQAIHNPDNFKLAANG